MVISDGECDFYNVGFIRWSLGVSTKPISYSYQFIRSVGNDALSKLMMELIVP